MIGSMPLQVATPADWVSAPLADFPAFLQDHASCERKAAATCMSMVAKYSDRHALVEPMVSLAREELEHFAQVYRVMHRMGVELGDDCKDDYVRKILRACRHEDRDQTFLDRLVISGLIEARGWERFAMLGKALSDPELGDFYQTLARSEAGHYKVFLRLAEHYFPKEEVDEAVTRLAAAEADALTSTPWGPRLH